MFSILHSRKQLSECTDLVPYSASRPTTTGQKVAVCGLACAACLLCYALTRPQRTQLPQEPLLIPITEVMPLETAGGSRVAQASFEEPKELQPPEFEIEMLEPAPAMHPTFAGGSRDHASEYPAQTLSPSPSASRFNEDYTRHSAYPSSSAVGPRLARQNILFIESKLTEAMHLAERGALYSARAMLVEALRENCRMLDAVSGTQVHSSALLSALRAIEEADDFHYRGMHLESDLETDGFIAGHETPVLKGSKGTSALRARDTYYRYAREQLQMACGQERVAGRVCYALGKVESEIRKRSNSPRQSGPREIPYYQVSFKLDPRDNIVANELGVALVGEGQLRSAADMFERSLAIKRAPTAIANLATVYRRLGDPRQQELARANVAVGAMTQSNVRVVSVEEFNGQMRLAQPVHLLPPNIHPMRRAGSANHRKLPATNKKTIWKGR